VNGADVGFKLLSDDGKGNIGSVSFIDSTFANVKNAAIQLHAPSSQVGTGTTGLTLDNVILGGNIVDDTGSTVLASGKYSKVSRAQTCKR